MTPEAGFYDEGSYSEERYFEQRGGGRASGSTFTANPTYGYESTYYETSYE